MSNLKPVVFVQGKYAYSAQNTTQQIMLLKALQITQDPKKLREMIGVKTVAEVYRTLDKIQMRKEYHDALVKFGLTFDYAAKTLKGAIDDSFKSSDKLKGVSIFLKSIGLDKYEESSISGGSWEDALLRLNQEADSSNLPPKVSEYDVIAPPVPENIRKAKEKANKEAKGLYE